MISHDKLKQSVSHWWQRKTRGWDDSETWSLDVTIAKFVLPRLKRFKELNMGYPDNNQFGMPRTKKEWDDILDEIIFAMEFMSSDERFDCEDTETWERVQKGLSLFGDWFTHLWW